MDNRPNFPKRAIITSGMPYGNKELHFGHIGGLYVQADTFARFLRDRIGDENVIFQSGTDCYGSPAMEGYRKIKEEKHFGGTIEDYVEINHKKQVDTFNEYEIKLDFFGASAFGIAKEFHKETCANIFERLYEVGALKKMDTLQFFDEKLGIFLNGRQVRGRCPIQGCKSEKAYADECDLGHQFMPEDLIAPVSALTGEMPILKTINNWYFDLPKFTEILKNWNKQAQNDASNRSFASKEIEEFLKNPEIYIVKKDQMELWNNIKNSLPKYELIDDEKKNSFTITFDRLEDRETACNILRDAGIRYRKGKTLVPFRLTGNIEWGVPVPEKEGLKDLTFYVWPESLIAPISFTKAFLSTPNSKNCKDWKKWWCDKDCEVYQFLGEDNIYFYGPAEMAMFLAMQGNKCSLNIPEGNIRLPKLVVNKHILYMGVKASSSSETMKPPMAHELLSYYTPEQLRMHFLGMGLGNSNASFKPKVYIPNAPENEMDLALKEGNLLTNVYNRVIRHLLNEVKDNFNNVIPYETLNEEIKQNGNNIILEYESLMHECKLHTAVNLLDNYIRNINKYWSKYIKESETKKDKSKVIHNTLHMIRVANTLLHPMAPVGTELVANYFGWDKKCFDWKFVFDEIEMFIKDKNNYIVEPIESKFDFFKKHESQLI